MLFIPVPYNIMLRLFSFPGKIMFILNNGKKKYQTISK